VAVLVTGPVLLTSAWVDMVGDRGHPGASHTYRVYADIAPAFAESASLADFQLMQVSQSFGALVESGSIQAATTVGQAGALALPADDRDLPDIRILRVEENFPSFFDVRWAGEAVETFDPHPQLWLTQTSSARLAGALGRLPHQMMVNGQVVAVRGVIDDPPPGSHLRYGGLLSGRILIDDGMGVLYVKTHDRQAASNHLGPLISQSIGFPAGAMRARLLPLSTLRFAPLQQRYEPPFVHTGRGLELAVALSAGIATVLGGVLALMLLVSSLVERRRQVLGVRVMLGRSPARMAAVVLAWMAVTLVLALPLALWGSWSFGGVVLQALDKTDMAALRGVLIAVSVGVAIMVLVGAAIALSELFFTAPARLALRGAEQVRNTTGSLIMGLGVLSAGACTLVFAASQFAAEVRLGAHLSADADRVWSLRPASAAQLNAIRLDLEQSALVSDVAVLGWRPFAGMRLNAAVALEGGGLVQVSTLTSETGWSQFWGARRLAGPPDLLDQLEGRSYCMAVAEYTTAQALLPQAPLDVVGRMVHAGGGLWSCRIVAVIEDARRGKRALHGDPVLHMINAPLQLETRTSGTPDRYLLVRFRGGVSSEAMQDTVSGYALRAPPRTLVQLGMAAYERERRIAQIIAGCAFVLASVLLIVTLALTLDTLEAQRKSIAVRRALGAQSSTLARRAVRPSVWAVLGSAIATTFVSLLMAPFWRDWAGLTGQQWDAMLMSMVSALALSAAPLAVVFVVSVFVISGVSPSRLIRDA